MFSFQPIARLEACSPRNYKQITMKETQQTRHNATATTRIPLQWVEIVDCKTEFNQETFLSIVVIKTENKEGEADGAR